MTAGHLVSYFHLAFLGNVNLSQTYYSCRKFIAYCDIVLLAFEDTVNLLVLDNIVMKELFYAVVFLFVGGPLVGIDIEEVNFLQLLQSEFAAFGDHVDVKIVLYSL